MSEVDEFISKANDKLNSSKILFDNQQYATSVSASYYCMFLTAKALLIKKNHYPKSHEGLISLFGQVYMNHDEFDRKIAKYLAHGQSLRENADYDAVDGITENIARLWVNNAEEFMNESKKIIINYFLKNVLFSYSYYTPIFPPVHCLTIKYMKNISLVNFHYFCLTFSIYTSKHHPYNSNSNIKKLNRNRFKIIKFIKF